MLIKPMIEQLHQLRLHGMAAALERLLHCAQLQALSFEERLSVMIQHVITNGDSKRLAQRLLDKLRGEERIPLGSRIHTRYVITPVATIASSSPWLRSC